MEDKYMNNEEYECIDCTHLALQQPLRLLCTVDGHNSVMVDGDFALKHLYKECPLKKKEMIE